jgi:hypothetical protein
MSRYYKAIMAILSFAGVMISAGVFDGTAQTWAQAIVSALGAALVYFVPNTTPAGQVPDPTVSETGPFVA